MPGAGRVRHSCRASLLEPLRMHSVSCAGKADELELSQPPAAQRDLDLNLYGTIRAALSTFERLTHIGPQERHFERAIRRAAYWRRRSSSDLNRPKHQHTRFWQDGWQLRHQGPRLLDCLLIRARADRRLMAIEHNRDIDYHETEWCLL